MSKLNFSHLIKLLRTYSSFILVEFYSCIGYPCLKINTGGTSLIVLHYIHAPCLVEDSRATDLMLFTFCSPNCHLHGPWDSSKCSQYSFQLKFGWSPFFSYHLHRLEDLHLATAELPWPKPVPAIIPDIGTAGHLRCKDRSLTRDWGAVLRRCGNPSSLSHNILSSEFEVFPIPCKNGENWKTGSSDLDFKISMSCPILIANTELLLIFLSQHNYENEMITHQFFRSPER